MQYDLAQLRVRRVSQPLQAMRCAQLSWMIEIRVRLGDWLAGEVEFGLALRRSRPSQR